MPDWFNDNAPKAAPAAASAAAPSGGGDWFDLYDPTRKPASAEDFAPTVLPYKGQTMPGDTFAEKLRNAASVLGGEAVGGLKGLAHSAINVGQMAIDAGVIPGTIPAAFNPAFRNPLLQRAEADTAYSDDPSQLFGGKLETAAELAAPALDVAKGGIALAKAAPGMMKNVSPMAVDIATHLIPGGSTIRRGTKIVKVLSDIIDNTVAAAKQGPTLGDVGRLNTEKAPTLTEALTGTLEDLRQPEPPARVTTPPPAGLPPGYAPRASVPRRVAPEPLAAAPPADAPAPAKRLYFLKPEAEMRPAAREPVAPSDFTDPAQLPASWRARTDQPIAPLTSADVDALTAQLRASGVAPADALKAVAKNPSLPPNVRVQLITALGKVANTASRSTR